MAAAGATDRLMDWPTPHTIDDAVALHRSGRLDEAGAIYQAILQQQPDHADALHLSGQLEILRGNHAAAFGLIRRATELHPDNAVFYSSLGAALKGMGHFDAAVASYDMALAIQGDYAEAHYNRGNALVELQQHAQAVASYDEAIRLKPDHAEAHYNRGNALRALRDIPAAIASYDRAIQINSQHTDARLSLGNALHDSGHIDAAKASFSAVITQDAGCAQALWGKSLSLLLSGEFEAGWELYESRWDQPFGQSQRRDFAQPLWLGREPLAGRTVLLHSEQGLGDTIQFCRYARLVAERGARVVLEVPLALVGLMGTLAGVDQVVAKGQALPAFDLHCPLMSLPLVAPSLPAASSAAAAGSTCSDTAYDGGGGPVGVPSGPAVGAPSVTTTVPVTSGVGADSERPPSPSAASWRTTFMSAAPATTWLVCCALSCTPLKPPGYSSAMKPVDRRPSTKRGWSTRSRRKGMLCPTPRMT